MVALLGIPDILGCIKGQFVAIELKRDKKQKPTRLQAHVLSLISRAGGLAYIASPETMESLLEELRNERKG